LEAVLTLCKEQGWLKARGSQRTDSTHALAKVRALNRAECVVETLRHALNVLAVVAPEWGLLAAIESDPQCQWMLSVPAVGTALARVETRLLAPGKGGTWRAEEERLEAANAPTPDRHALPDVHMVLEQWEFLPQQHLADAGYVDDEELVASPTNRQGLSLASTGPERLCVKRFRD
jgi:hypothetical protein